MTRMGVLVVLLALAGSAAADKTAAKPAPAKKADPKAAKTPDKAAPTDDTAGAADQDAPPAGEDAEPKLPPHVTGPQTVDLGNSITVDLPAGMILLERVEAKKFVEQGGTTGENVIAVIANPESTWWMSVEYEDVGYVSDEDADKLDENELFQSYVEGVKEQNIRRKEMGLPDMFLDGWSEKPKYDSKSRHLVWGLKGHSTRGVSINFFTRILGRAGYMSVDLIDSPENIDKAKVDAAKVLDGFHYKAGSRYEDHQSNDKSSGMGLRALVLGGGAVGVGLAAKSGLLLKLLLVFKKGIILVVAAIGGFFKWIFGKKKKDNFEIPPSDPSQGPPPNV